MWKKAFPRDRIMSDASCEAQSLLQKYISPPIAGESMKVRIARAARKVGLTYSRTGKLWYGNARRVDAVEIDLLRAAARAKAALKNVENDSGKDLQSIINELRTRIAEVEARIQHMDKVSRSNS